MTTRTQPFTAAERRYLSSQRLGRLATVDVDGVLQNSPVGYFVNEVLGTVDIFGLAMGSTRKFRNIRHDPHVALVVDDVASVDPWSVRGVEIRGMAEALEDQDPPRDTMSREIIRIHPRRVISWGVDPDRTGMQGRDVGGSDPDDRVA